MLQTNCFGTKRMPHGTLLMYNDEVKNIRVVYSCSAYPGFPLGSTPPPKCHLLYKTDIHVRVWQQAVLVTTWFVWWWTGKKYTIYTQSSDICHSGFSSVIQSLKHIKFETLDRTSYRVTEVHE